MNERTVALREATSLRAFILGLDSARTPEIERELASVEHAIQQLSGKDQSTDPVAHTVAAGCLGLVILLAMMALVGSLGP